MKILAIADIHGNFSHLEDIKEKAGKIDVVVISGDITNFGPSSQVDNLKGIFNVPVFAVPGNCDQRDIIEVLDNSEIVNLHKNTEKMGEFTFVGIGGSSPTPFNTPFELEEQEIEDALEPMFNTCDEDCKSTIVLVSHAPPKGLLDSISGDNVGSASVAKFIDRSTLVICAHIHEARGFARSGDTFLVNPGMAAEGYAALIELEQDNVSVSFIEA
ncbi:metallophosphoesterase [Methanococcoides sp. SA1]|nr:metallophosphoesterase [Methanococcoides sp. SA1]